MDDIRAIHEIGGRIFKEDHHGSSIEITDQSPPGRQDILLRGSFVLVCYHDRSGSYDDTRLVLLGFEPENRKLIYEFEHDPFQGGPITLWKVQDSPGMAREAKS